MLQKAVFIVLISLCASFLNAQQMRNIRNRTIVMDADTIRLDSLCLVPGSILVFTKDGKILDKSLYRVDCSRSLIIGNPSIKGESLKISYRVFDFSFSNPVYHKKLFLPDTTSAVLNKYVFRVDDDEINSFGQKDKIEKRGSISRGIIFGNNQDVTVNSGLNLQLSGKLSDNLNILAAISDNNIPIQPDGNTQQIQEFDKVYITLYNSTTNLTAGDFELTKPRGYFMNFYKKAQGASISQKFFTGKEKKSQLILSASGAISKGKYHRLVISGIEGNQGPYKLTGADNESFIIVLAGSEKIYMDGRLLMRGQENDYVIDYNMAEVSFTPRQPVTKDRRIVIEFEYSDKNYARFMLFSGNEFRSKKDRFWVNVFSEQDNKNQPIRQSLTEDEKIVLSEIGDSLQMAVVPNIDSVAFDNAQVLYRKMDTLVGGILYSGIYVYSVNPDSAFYRLGFSNVGSNHGNYIQIQSAANGRVYKWVAPVSGLLQGNYEPVVLLVTPKKKQMITMGGESWVTRTTLAGVEAAISNNDLNTFSSKNASDDAGYAVKLNLIQKVNFTDTAKTKINFSGNFHLIDKNFSEIERFRTAEFERDWNMTSAAVQKSMEQFYNFAINFYRKNAGTARYDLEYIDRGSVFSAYRNNIKTDFQFGGFKTDVAGSYMNSDGPGNNTRFSRLYSTLSKEFKYFILGVKEEYENNLWTTINADSLSANSFSYFQYEGFVGTPDTLSAKARFSYKNRKDYLPFSGTLKHATGAEDFSFNSGWSGKKGHMIGATITYRKLQIEDTLVAVEKAQNTLTGRLENSLKFFKGAITTSLFYEIGSGLEMKQEYSYLQVAPGQGVYTWNDYNLNGVKELDEFEVAAFQDQADYIRVVTPSNQYVKIFNNQFNGMVNLIPERIWKKQKGLKKIFSRFSNQFALRAENKTSNDRFEKYFNPFGQAINDTSMKSAGWTVRNNFSFNKTNSVFGVDYILQENQNKVLLVNGSDLREGRIDGLRVRLNVSKQFSILENLNKGKKKFTSGYFSNKNYSILYYTSESSFNWQPGTSFRLSLIYKYTDKKNITAQEKMYGNDAGFEIRQNIASKGSLSIKANYILLTYRGETNSPVAYEMLEGLLPGNNATWSLLYQRNISGSLQLGITYNGRKSEETSAVHTGGVQLRAFF